jgi:hypothetical protein
LGLVELPIYGMPNGDRLVVPRVLARTHLIARNVVAVPDGYMVEAEEEGNVAEIDPDRAVLAEQSQRLTRNESRNISRLLAFQRTSL